MVNGMYILEMICSSCRVRDFLEWIALIIKSALTEASLPNKNHHQFNLVELYPFGVFFLILFYIYGL
jgi:hypothetical protein